MRLLVLDIDGVLTDGRVALGPQGQETKSLSYRDIDAVFQARRDGLQIALVTGEQSAMVEVISRRLAVDLVVSGAKDKAAALRDVCQCLNIPLSETCYVGDSDRDGDALALAGLALAPADASSFARRNAHRVLAARGGNGAVAEAVALVRARNADNTPAVGRVAANEFEKLVVDSLDDSISLTQTLAASMAPQIATLAEWVIETLRGGRKLLLFGDGGGAANAQHVAAEFVGRYARGREAWPAIALSTDTSVLTDLGNDCGMEGIFARQVEAMGKPGDLAVVFCPSGNSPSVINGAAAGRARGLRTVALTGQDGGRLAPLCDLVLHVPSQQTMRIQECHITICHAMCEVVEAALDSPLSSPPRGA